MLRLDAFQEDGDQDMIRQSEIVGKTTTMRAERERESSKEALRSMLDLIQRPGYTCQRNGIFTLGLQMLGMT